MNISINQKKLTQLLQMAYSAEMAAAYAYRGHWKSVNNQLDKAQIQKIEEEEWQHRSQIGVMLGEIGVKPRYWKEKKALIIGRTLGFLCHFTGKFAPLYGAGKLESKNIKEYEIAAQFARDCGQEEWVECLLTMAEVEWEHEKYFRAQVLKHTWGRKIPIWPEPPPKEKIRENYQR